MATKENGWEIISKRPLLVRREYSFGVGMANSSAFEIDDGKLLLVSPPAGIDNVYCDTAVSLTDAGATP